MYGTITVDNINFLHEGLDCKGACFTLSLPIKLNDIIN